MLTSAVKDLISPSLSPSFHKMSFKHMPEPELQELLAQLARFYRANETRISADQVSKCLEYLPAIESSALNRMFSLIYQKKARPSAQRLSFDYDVNFLDLTEPGIGIGPQGANESPAVDPGLLC